MVKSKELEDLNTVHDLSEYHFAKLVTKDHPKIIEIYNKLLPVLLQYAAYQGVYPVIAMIEDSKYLLEFQLRHYSKVANRKGRVDQDEENEDLEFP